MSVSWDRNKLILGSILLVIASILAWYASVSYRMSALLASAREALRMRDFSAARETLQRAHALRPADPDALLLSAQTARRMGKLDEARNYLREVSRSHTDPSAVELEQRLLRLQHGDLNDAQVLLETIRADPDNLSHYLMLEAMVVGSLQIMHLGFANQCVSLWNNHYKNPQDQLQGALWRADLSLRRGDYETALDLYRGVLKHDDSNEIARIHLVEILVRYNPTESLKHLQILQENDPKSRSLQLLHARALRSLGELENAGAMLDSLLADHPEDIDVLLERGQLALDGQQFADAERFLRKAESLAPHRRDTILALSRCYQLAGKTDLAQLYHQRLTTIDAEIQRRIDEIFGKKKPKTEP